MDHLDRFGLLMGAVSREWRSRINERLAPFGLSHSTWTVLRHLRAAREGMRQADLARIAGIEGPTLVRIIDRLEKLRWVRRVADERDRRAKLVIFLPGARRRFADVEKTVRALREECLEAFSVGELTELIDKLQKLREQLEDLPLVRGQPKRA